VKEEKQPIDTIAAEIRQLISIGATQTELIAVVAYLADLFPDMTPAQLSQALQVGRHPDGVDRRSRVPGGPVP
jgi:hypothetical protein